MYAVTYILPSCYIGFSGVTLVGSLLYLSYKTSIGIMKTMCLETAL